MVNVLYAAIFYALFQILATFAAPRLSDQWFLVLGTLSMVVCTTLIAGSQLLLGNELGKITVPGAIFIILANASIAVFTIFLGRAFQNVSPGTVTPFVFGGAILMSTIVSFAINRTMPTGTQILSLLMISGGLVLLGTQSK